MITIDHEDKNKLENLKNKIDDWMSIHKCDYTESNEFD